MNRHAHSRDSNHADLVEGLETNGYAVLDLSGVGRGCPDVMVQIKRPPWTAVLLEFKAGKKKPQKNQRKWHEAWPGPVYVVRSLAEALACMQLHGGNE